MGAMHDPIHPHLFQFLQMNVGGGEEEGRQKLDEQCFSVALATVHRLVAVESSFWESVPVEEALAS